MRFIQAALALIAFVAYILFQIVVKKKKITELVNDMMAIAFFAAIWAGIYYWMRS